MASDLPMSQTEMVGVECASRELGACLDREGRFWVTWVSHLNGLDRIMARHWTSSEAGPVAQVSEAPGEYVSPAAVASRRGPLFLWRACDSTGWHIKSRLLTAGGWQTELSLPLPVGNTHAFTAASDGAGRLGWYLWPVPVPSGRYGVPVAKTEIGPQQHR